MNSMFDVSHVVDALTAQLKLSGRLDGITAPVFEKKLEELLNAGNRQMIMDCEQLIFVSSAGLRVFLSFAKKIKKADGKMALYHVQPVIHSVFQATGFVDFLNLCANREEALAAVQPGS
jgi:anti-anti-sigma factor